MARPMPHQTVECPDKFVLADEMGLGKTVTCLLQLERALSAEEKASSSSSSLAPRAVIVVNLNNRVQWQQEFARFLPHRKLEWYHGKRAAASSPAAWAGRVLLTTNGTLKSEYRRSRDGAETVLYGAAAGEQQWLRFLAVDEAHSCRFRRTGITQAVEALARRSARVALLTGNPIMKVRADLEVLLHLVGVSAKECERLGWDRLLSKHVVWRTASQVGIVLPPLYEVDVECALTPLQEQMFDAVLADPSQHMVCTVLTQIEVAAAAVSSQSVLHERCPSPLHRPDMEAGHLARLVLRTSGKLQELCRLLAHLWRHDSTTGVLVFSRFVKVLRLAQLVVQHGWGLRRPPPLYCSSVSAKQRCQMQADYLADRLGPLLLLSTDGGGQSLNLAARATVIVLMEPDYLPTAERQVHARIHRIGQQRPTYVYNLLGSRMDVCLREYQRTDMVHLAEAQPETWKPRLESIDRYLAQHKHSKYRELSRFVVEGQI